MTDKMQIATTDGKLEWLSEDYSLPLVSIQELRPMNVIFSVKGGSLTFNLDTNDITVSEGVDLTEAAKEFLNTCAKLLGKPAIFTD